MNLSKLSNEELIRLAKNGDSEAKETFFINNERLCFHVAKKFSGRLEQEELVGCCRLGIVKAFNTFDVDRGYKFVTYAVRCMENEIRINLRKLRKKVPNPLQLEDTLAADADGHKLTVADVVGVDDRGFDQFIAADSVQYLLSEYVKKAKENELRVLRIRLANEDMTQGEIAEKLNLAQSYVSRLEKRALESLRKIAVKLDMTDRESIHNKTKKQS